MAGRQMTTDEYFEALNTWVQNNYHWRYIHLAQYYPELVSQAIPNHPLVGNNRVVQQNYENALYAGNGILNNAPRVPTAPPGVPAAPGGMYFVTLGPGPALHDALRHVPQAAGGFVGAPGLPLQVPGGLYGIPGFINSMQNGANGGEYGFFYCIPSTWKRMIAEIFDGILLLVLKLFMILVIADFADWAIPDLRSVIYNGLTLDLAFTTELTLALVYIEMLYRFCVTFLETYFIFYGFAGVLNCTPGKKLMNLRVVSCTKIYNTDGTQRIPSNVVFVVSGQPVTLSAAFKRSLTKNLCQMLFGGLCAPVAAGNFHGRSGHDLFGGTIVVEPWIIGGV